MLTTDTFRLDGKVAVVTGSGRNIGRAIAEAFAACGAKVVVNGHRDGDAIEAVARGIKERGGDAIAVMADVSKDEEAGRLIESAAAAFGPVDILVSNVAVRR